jgi:hypothetical protein
VTLGTEVVDLVRANLVEGIDERGRIAQVAVMQEQRDIGLVRIPVQVVDPAGIE